MTDSTAEGLPAEGLAIVADVTAGLPPRRGAEAPVQRATWLLVRPDGGATAFAGKVEYGQGIRTGLAVEVADELRLPLDRVEVVLSDTDRVPWDMGTFGSQSTARVGLQLRKAAATAREALLELAADRLDLPVSDLECRDGRVATRGEGDPAVTYGELVAGASVERELDGDVALTPPSQFTVMGRHARRIDAEERVTGRAIFTRDVTVPEMRFAAVVRPPSYGAKPTAVDATAAEAMPGVESVVHEGDLVAVVAGSDEAAARAASVVRVTWDEPADVRTRAGLPELLESTAQDHYATQEEGDLEQGFRDADGILEATYHIPYISNAPMEPRAAVAQWEGERLTVWAGTQRPFGVRSDLARHFGIDEERVRVITPEVGGGFGGKSMYPVAVEAATVARAAGYPVRIAYTRDEETVWSTFRPAAQIDVRSGFTSDGRIVAWEFTARHSGERAQIGQRGSQTPYDTPHVRVQVAHSDSPLPSGSFRSLGGAVNHFAREMHIDEIAAATGIDPVELRLRNLSDSRFRRVLETAAERIGWQGAARPAHRGEGIALGLDVGSYAATAVQLEIEDGRVRVRRVEAALDCGLVVNPDGAVNQVEGSIVMGLGAALYEEADFAGGRVLNPGLSTYRVPRMQDAPRIEVALVGDAETPSTGAGEPAIVPIAPAISNAVFDLTGEWYRELPIQRRLR